MKSPPPTVFIVDDEKHILDALRLIMKAEGWDVETFENARDFLTACHGDKAGCILLDVCLPDISGLDVIAQLKAKGVVLPIIMMTGHGDIPIAVTAIKRGAYEFVEKPIDSNRIREFVRAAMTLDTEQREQHEHARKVVTFAEKLTSREREVMKLVVEGLPNKDIAKELGVQPKTIEAHRAQVMRKMDASSLPDLVRKHQILERSASSV